MTGNKTCNKCKKKYLGWDLDFNKKTGKWKLDNHKRPDGKWCNKPPEQKWVKVKNTDLYKCELCIGSYGWLLTEEAHTKHPEWVYSTLESHMLLMHPNNEIRDDTDYEV